MNYLYLNNNSHEVRSAFDEIFMVEAAIKFVHKAAYMKTTCSWMAPVYMKESVKGTIAMKELC